MRFDIITIFPEIFDFYFQHSLLSKAKDKGVVKIKAHNLRDFARDKHKTVDDKPFGGGRGMVLKVESIYRAVKELSSFGRRSLAPSKKAKVILFSPRGKKFSQKMATQWGKLGQLILICGRYEGVDERVAKYIADEVVSIGDYVTMGGELPALLVVEAVARLLPGVVGKSEDLIKERITKTKGFVEYPQYTRPEVFNPREYIKKGKACPPKYSGAKVWRVPKVLLSGNHKEIEKWRAQHSKIIE